MKIILLISQKLDVFVLIVLCVLAPYPNIDCHFIHILDLTTT